MKRKWSIHKPITQDDIKKFPDINPVILQLLFNRDLKTKEEIETFLSPQYEKLSSPFILTDMDKAVARVLQAISKQEKITIYADYDADAVTACAVMYRGLKQLGVQNVGYYIPDRFAEGYGLNKEAIKEIAKDGSKVIVTVDCGINANEEVELANSLGLDVIITDHHTITGDLPRALAVVNHHRDGHEDLSGLTGVGMAFKLIQGIFTAVFPEEYKKSFGWEVPEFILDTSSGLAIASPPPHVKGQGKYVGLSPFWEKWLLDLVAIGTVADVQSLRGENRILVKYGLQVLAKSKWIGLKHMMLNAGLDESRPLDTFVLGFIIGPRINAAGRIQHADLAFKLLVSDDFSEVQMHAGQIESLNSHRQRLTEQIFSEARSQAELQRESKILLAVGDDWPKGVVGLVASKLTDEFNRPAVVLERSGGMASGSARSVGNFNIVSAFQASATHLDRYGGHAQAAGLTIKPDKIQKFYESLIAFADENLKEDDLVKKLQIDAELQESLLDLKLVEKIKQLEPFGQNNPSPKFLIKGMNVENLRTVGATNKHLKMQVTKNNKVYNLIGFSQGFQMTRLQAGDLIDVVCEPSENSWNGRKELQLKIVDLRKQIL